MPWHDVTGKEKKRRGRRRQ